MKAFRVGTHRVWPAEQTLERVAGLLKAFGITRVANITGLDRIGIPVVSVSRPNARSLAVAQGKGMTLAAAKAGGAMEAIERYHSEHIMVPLKMATYEDLRYTHAVIDPDTLGPSTSYHPYLQILWAEGRDLLSNEHCWVPFELVHTNFTLPFPTGSGAFAMTSNGVASGNHMAEALSHGICEVVERHSTALWRRASPVAQARTRINLGTVNDPICRELLRKYDEARVSVAVWETTSIGIPSFLCAIADSSEMMPGRAPACAGMGCHPSREVALARALTEAAQSRLTVIAGSRDDVTRAAYDQVGDRDLLRLAHEELDICTRLRTFGEVPTNEHDSVGADLEWELSCLEHAGFQRVVFVDLSRPEFKIPVVRVIIPGCERDATNADSLADVFQRAAAHM